MAEQVVNKIRAADYSLFQLMKPDVIADPYPLYRKLREYEPVHWDPYLHSWVVTSYAESIAALAKHKAGRTPSAEKIKQMGLAVLCPYASMMKSQVLFSDPPRHTSLRSSLAAVFAPKHVQDLQGYTAAVAERVLQASLERGHLEVVHDFVTPFLTEVLAKMLGLPVEDAPLLRPWALDLTELFGNFEHKPERTKHLIASLEQMRGYLVDQVKEQRVRPREGVLSILLAEQSEMAMSEDEIVANVIQAISGGLEEPSNLITCGIYTLLRHPEQLELLMRQPELMSSAIEELLRYEAPTQQTGRLAAEDVELGGKQIKQGDAIAIVLGAANRDPLRFENPETLDITRKDNRHLSLGWASHYCLGAALTRMEVAVGLETMLRLLSDLKPVTEKPEWRAMASLRGIKSLELSFNAKLTLERRGEMAYVQ